MRACVVGAMFYHTIRFMADHVINNVVLHLVIKEKARTQRVNTHAVASDDFLYYYLSSCLDFSSCFFKSALFMPFTKN